MDESGAAAALAAAAQALARGDTATAVATAAAALRSSTPDPASVRASIDLIAGLRRDGRTDAALAVADALVAAAPREPMGLIARSQVAHARGDLDAAVADTRRAMALSANPEDGLGRLAELLYEAGDLDAAAAAADALLRARPRDLAMLARRAEIAEAAGDSAGAAAAIETALAVRRADGIGSPHLLMALLRLGRLGEAVPDLSLRWQTAGAPPRPFPQPSWRGAPIGDGALLVWGEQGLGEEIWAGALLPGAAAQAGRLVVECAPRLAALMARSFPAATVVARTDPPAAATQAGDIRAQCAAVDLLAALGPDVALARPHPPYLRADPAAVAAHRARYRALGDGPVIGLSWRSANRRAPQAKTSDLADWRPILDRRAVLVDLQYGATDADRAAAAAEGRTIHRDPAIDPLGDLDPVAAHVAAMDMVVTVSNTTAHLAGALGVPTAVLLPRGRGQVWSWLDAARPWYSRMRICRQPRPGDWRAAIAAAARHLDESLA